MDTTVPSTSQGPSSSPVAIEDLAGPDLVLQLVVHLRVLLEEVRHAVVVLADVRKLVRALVRPPGTLFPVAHRNEAHPDF